MKTLLYLLLSFPLFAQNLKQEIETYLGSKIRPGNDYTVVISNPYNCEGLIIDEQRDPVIGKETALIPVINLNNGKKPTFISVKFDLFTEVLVAEKNIPSKTLLKPDLFTKKQIGLSKLNGKICSSDYNLTNRRTAKFIAKGEVLKLEFLEMIPDINAGDKISLEVRVNQTVLTTDAFARQQGNVGDIIKINFKNRIFSAKVIDSKKARIE